MARKRRINPALAATPVALGLASAAHAQDATIRPLSVRVGATILTSSTGRESADSLGWRLGLGYSLPGVGLAGRERGRPSIDLDYAHNSGGGRVSTLGIAYVERIALAPRDGRTSVPYFGLGIGLYNVSARYSVGGGSNGGSSNGGSSNGGTSNGGASLLQSTSSRYATKDDFHFGGKLLLGVDMADRYFAEVSYDWAGSAAGVSGDSVGLMVGMRF
ncbi:MAG: hypothetical protein IT208_04775 [Chthonomonadales bacterium]|nr:hypothetical protein [Chthonomonadales bacterium]